MSRSSEAAALRTRHPVTPSTVGFAAQAPSCYAVPVEVAAPARCCMAPALCSESAARWAAVAAVACPRWPRRPPRRAAARRCRVASLLPAAATASRLGPLCRCRTNTCRDSHDWRDHSCRPHRSTTPGYRVHIPKSYSRPRVQVGVRQKQASCIVYSCLPHEKRLCSRPRVAILDLMGLKTTRRLHH